MSIVDQHIEVLEEIVAENALNVQIGGIEMFKVINEHLLVGNSVGAGFDQVELREGSRLTRSDACDHGRALSIQMKFGGERGIDHSDLGAAIQLEVVGTGVVDGYGQNDLVAIDEAEG